MIIDFHTHVFPPEWCRDRTPFLDRDDWFRLLYANPRSRMVAAEELIASMDEAGVDVSITFNFSWSDSGLCRAGNDYVIDAVSRFPDRLIGFACVNPTDTPATQIEIDRTGSAGFRGIGELTPAGQQFQVEDERIMTPLVEAAVSHRMPILLHANEQVGHSYHGKGTQAPWGIIELARSFPNATFVAAHWGGGLFFYEVMPELLASLRNVYYDTSASLRLYRDRVFRVAADIIPNKMLFATDFPLINHDVFVRRVRLAGLSAEHQRMLLADNARRLMNLTGEPDGT